MHKNVKSSCENKTIPSVCKKKDSFTHRLPILLTGQSLIKFRYFPLIHLVAQDMIEKTLVYSEVTSQCYLTVETHINTKYHLSFT